MQAIDWVVDKGDDREQFYKWLLNGSYEQANIDRIDLRRSWNYVEASYVVSFIL